MKKTDINGNPVDFHFRKTKEGETVFCPWGVLYKNYLLKTDDEERELRSLVRKMQTIWAPLLLAGYICTIQYLWISALWFIFMTLVYGYFVWKTLKILKITQALAEEDGIRYYAENTKRSFLEFAVAGSVLGALLGIFFTLCGLAGFFIPYIADGGLALLLFGPWSRKFWLALSLKKKMQKEEFIKSLSK